MRRQGQRGPSHPDYVEPEIKKLVTMEYVGTAHAPIAGKTAQQLLKIAAESEARYKVLCSVCGDVTRRESGGHVNDANIGQAALYRQRHLAKHLTALAEEINCEIG